MNERSEAELRARRRARLANNGQWGLTAGLAVLGLLVAAVFALGGSPDMLSIDAPFFSGGDTGPGLDSGEAVYASTCLACHGVRGAGNEAAGIPALDMDGEAWMKTAQELESIILDGGHIMPGQRGLLSDEEIGMLLDYLQSLWSEEQRDAYLSGSS